MAIALDIIKKKSGLDDTMAQQALDIKNSQGNDAFKEFVAKNKPVQSPVAGVPPAVTPTPAPVGTTTPSGATLTPEGNIVQPTTTAPTTTAPAPTPVPESVVAKTATPTENITQADFQKANAESEKIKAQNEAQMTLNQQNADIKDKERQKIAEEQKIASTPTDMQGILSSMVAGVPVAPQKSGNYINAKFQYDQYSKFNAMTPTQLLDNLKQGQIGTDMDKLLSQNPSYVQAKAELDKIQKTNSINNNIRTIYGGVTGAESETPDYLTQASDALIAKLGLDKDQTSAEAFAEYVTGDQKIVDYTNQLSNVNRQIADTSKLINDGIKSLKSQKGDMPADALVVLMNSTFKDVNETLTNLNNTKTYLEADLKNATEMAYNRFGAVSKDIENSRNIKNSVISNLIQSQFSLAEKKTEADMAKQIAQEALNDPYTAIPAMIEEYKKLGIPFTRSTQQIIQEFEGSGKDLATYLTELQGQIQSKPEYQRMQAIQMGQLSDAEKLQAQYQQQMAMNDRNFSQQLALNDVNFNQDVQKMAMQYDMNDVVSRTEFRRDLIGKGMCETQADAIVRNETGAWNGVTGEKLLYAEDGTFIKSSLKNTTNPDGGIECAEYISKMVGSRVGSTWEEKKKLNDETTGKVGSIAVWRPVKSGELAKYGHAGVIVGEEGNNWIIKSANYNVDGRISTDTIPKSEIEGYRTTKLNGTLAGGQDKESSALADSIVNGTATLSDLTATVKEKVLPVLQKKIDSQLTGDEQRNAIVRSSVKNKEISDSSLQKIQDMQTVKMQLNSLEDTLKNVKTGPIMGILSGKNPYNVEAQVALAQLAGITPKVARGIFGEVGVLTDTDIQNYQRTLPNLTSTEEKNKLVVQFMRDLLAEGYKNAIVTQAKGQRNMSEFLNDYDEITRIQGTGASAEKAYSKYETNE